MPVISVVMPAYNAEKYIGESIESILKQTFTDFEFIIIDNASTDSTSAIATSYNDPRIRVVYNPVKGLSSSLNMGLNVATGKFIARMDADDIAHPARFKKQVDFFDKNPPIDLCASWVQLFGSETGIHRKYTKHDQMKADLLFLNTICHPSVMFKREKLRAHNLYYDESLVLLEDYTLWVEAIDKLKFATVPEVLLKYRIHETNSSSLKASNKKILDEGHDKIFIFFYEKLGLIPTKEVLEMHRNLGTLQDDLFKKFTVKDYFDLLVQILKANERTLYFQQQSLKNTVLSVILYLFKKSVSFKNFFKMIEALKGVYNVKDYTRFIKEKIILKSKAVTGF